MERSCCTSLAVALALGLAAAPAPVAAERGAPAAAEAKAKACKKGRVPERVRKKTRCVPASKALPKPKAIDVRKTGAAYVLNASFSKLRDRRGKRLPSLPKLLRKIHPRAEQALLRATSAGLARFDGARVSGARGAAACSGSGTISSTFNAGDGLSVEMRTQLGADATMTLGLQSQRGNRSVRLEIEFPGCDEDGSQLDSCPTADGIVRGRDSKRVGIRAYVLEGDTLTWSQGFTTRGETTFRGVVLDDAQLDFFEPHNTETATISLGGSSRGFEPITMRTLVQRITRVDMPDGEFVLGPSIVDVSISSRGFEGAERRAAERDIEGKMRAEADKQFRDIIAKAIARFRTVEASWNQPNTCATMAFTPGANSKRLRRGEAGSFDARLDAKPGGSPAGASWTLVATDNAPFSPGAAASNPASFSHGAPLSVAGGAPIRAFLRAVSKAGVAEAEWMQPTEDDPPVNTIAGSFSGTQNVHGSILTWSGAATFTRVFPDSGANGFFDLTSSQYTVIASGLDGSGATACRQSGTKTVTGGSGSLDVSGQEPERGAPYTYSGDLVGQMPEAIEMRVTLHDCPPGAEDWEGREINVSQSFAPFDTRGGRVSPDGLDYTDSITETQGQVSVSWSWSMRGSP